MALEAARFPRRPVPRNLRSRFVEHLHSLDAQKHMRCVWQMTVGQQQNVERLRGVIFHLNQNKKKETGNMGIPMFIFDMIDCTNAV